MDIKTGLSIYNKQWLIEPNAAIQMLDFWMSMRDSSLTWDYQKSIGQSSKRASFSQNNIMFAPCNSREMDGFTGFDGADVAIIPICGPLMKSDFCGELGTASLKQLTQMASISDSVKTIIFLIDSPGGTVDGTKAFADVIKACPKQTIAFADGLMCSAAYWIGSSCDRVYASTELDTVGSIGTMSTLWDDTKQLEAKGIVVREYYASASTDKNKVIQDALDGDGKKLITEILDPMNDVFMATVKSNRAGKIKSDALSGKTYMGQKAIDAGLIDGIMPFEQLINQTRAAKNNYMTAAEFKSAHPKEYEEVFQAGAAAERDRVGSWMAFNEVDPAAVKAGIEAGKDISKTQMSELSLKAHSKQAIKDVEGEGANPNLNTNTAVPGATAEEKAKADFNAEVKKNLKNFKN